ncbi:MAG: glycosyltransferase family 2 protein [Bacteroidia bacterium]|nr:glycosyltransferase family 2 protein [Bacteroidia bacterium]
MIQQCVYIIEIILLFYIGFNVAYVFIFSVAGVFYKPTDFSKVEIKKYNKFAILIPAYKHDEVILNTVGHSLNQNYPRDKFDVIVIADSLKRLTIAELLVMPIKLVEVKFDESTKAKSLNTALSFLPEDYFDYCLVLDVDNVMEEDFLAKMNARLQNDEVIVQGHRTAKNLDTPFAILDGLSEEINNHIFRKGHVVLGVTSALSGSGQAMKFKTYKTLMSEIESPVEDKELEFSMVKHRIKVHFENDALVYDEKVQNAKVFSSQRKRWIASQFFDFHRVLRQGIYHLLFHGNLDFFDKALQRIILPRILLIGLSFFSCAIYFLPYTQLGMWFVGMFGVCSISYILAIPKTYYNFKTLEAALRLPQAFFLMVFAMTKSKEGAKKFIHTDHSSTIAHKNKES